ncbi:hypothetical protein DC58_04435 [Vibrio navarrensis]|uniref:hypothetical protein n=1 Tax=Vibrio navarrensis TaxID=29495 RepID=UPI00052C7BA3|nr:hypothetical protein [Vibrio navarrensis]KGK15097.1 hypothetical protein DC58_04435 [Vibrio navarrensis]
MFNQQKSVDYGFSLFPRLIGFVFVGKLASAGAVFRTIILWRWKFRELPQLIFGQARGWFGWLNQYFDHRFLCLNCRNSKSVFQIYELFQFSGFWLLFVSQNRVNLGLSKT